MLSYLTHNNHVSSNNFVVVYLRIVAQLSKRLQN